MADEWLIDELRLAGQEHLDAQSAARFDDKQGRPDPATDLATLAEFGVAATSTVIDFGAGTGQFAIPAAHEFARVMAVDVSPAMLGLLGRRASDLGLHNVECVLAGFLTYEHAGPPAQAVYSRNALHHLPDFWKARALLRIAQLLEPGGIFLLRDLIYDFPPADADPIFARWFAAAAKDASHGYTRADLAEHIRTENSTFRWLMEPMLEAAGFEVVSTDYVDSVFGAYVCQRR